MKKYTCMIIATGITFLMLLCSGTYVAAQHRERPRPPHSPSYRHDVPPPAETPPPAEVIPPDRMPQDVGYMSRDEFAILYNRVKKKPFKSDKLELVEVGSLDSRFSCEQCGRIMSLFSFDDDRLAVLELMGPHVVDPHNVSYITQVLTFPASREKALRIMGRR
ncbi:MAG: DUF4476 domain-containing protein [Bacteroides sp.]|nr:DUF4476 domain-containing protein [Bacteroides sp.]